MPLSRRAHKALEVASFGGSKFWRQQQVLEAAASSGGGSKLWRWQQALEEMVKLARKVHSHILQSGQCVRSVRRAKDRPAQRGRREEVGIRLCVWRDVRSSDGSLCCHATIHRL
jgi:hypothetical protein